MAMDLLMPVQGQEINGKANMLDGTFSDIELASGTRLLRGQYRIDRPLSQGGFGITYLAQDSLNRQVVVKECFPDTLCSRVDGHVHARSEEMQNDFSRMLRQFKREAYRLAALEHPGIVRVHQVFMEKGTAFLAMDYVDGDDLFTIVEDHPDRLDPETLRQLLVHALEALQYTHEQSILHRDISPDNFILNAENHVTLIDFGSAYEVSIQGDVKQTKFLAVKDGFSPYEFYSDGEAQDVTSDLYSLGATFYFLITGKKPPDSQSRLAAAASGKADPCRPLADLDVGLDRKLLESIDQALAIRKEDRVQSAKLWLQQLQDVAVQPTVKSQKPKVYDISQTISQLVSDTNSKLIPGKPQKLAAGEGSADASETDESSKNKSTPPKPVDLFGNPIDDVEKYLREQDKLCGRKKASGSSRNEQYDPHSELGGGDGASKSGIGRMFKKLRLGKRTSNSPVLQN